MTLAAAHLDLALARCATFTALCPLGRVFFCQQFIPFFEQLFKTLIPTSALEAIGTLSASSPLRATGTTGTGTGILGTFAAFSLNLLLDPLKFLINTLRRSLRASRIARTN